MASSRTVAVTGSASGIGAACRARLEKDGARIIGVDLHDADVVCDLETPEGRKTAIDGVTALAGDRLHGLVTCAGLGGKPSRPGSVVASVNYFGTVDLLTGLRPLLAAADDAAAVAISSNSTTIQPAVPQAVVAACLSCDETAARALADEAGSLAAYPATKLAVAYWVRRAATGPTWIGSGITLNAVAPGLTATALVTEQREDPFVGPLIAQFPIPAGRDGRPEEVAALVAFLLGRDARFFCGSVLFVDGGSDALLRTSDWPAAWEVGLGG